jgi:hypothetical protein
LARVTPGRASPLSRRTAHPSHSLSLAHFPTAPPTAWWPRGMLVDTCPPSSRALPRLSRAPSLMTWQGRAWPLA